MLYRLSQPIDQSSDSTMLRSYLEGLLMAREGVEAGCKENSEQHSTGMFIQSWRGESEHHMDPYYSAEYTRGVWNRSKMSYLQISILMRVLEDFRAVND